MRRIGKLRILSSKQFPLPNTKERFIHLATITDGIREFIFFKDKIAMTTYIEEITGGNLSQVKEEELWTELTELIKLNNLDKIVEQ